MGVFGLQTLVGRHADLNPGPPACESGEHKKLFGFFCLDNNFEQRSV